MNFDLNYIEKLVKMVSDSELTELALEEKDSAIIIRKEKEVVQAQTIVPQAIAAPVASPAPAAAPAATEEKATDAPKGTPITSPMVGTFYMASSPGAKPFVEVGSTIATGQVVCIIEAMKLMNEIEAEVSGKVTQICVTDGEAVEYGQVLMYVE